MKRTLLSAIFVCCTLAVSAQDAIRVNYQGQRPTISDFVWAFLNSRDIESEDEETDEVYNSVRNAWINHREGRRQPSNVTLTVDQSNGYVLFEHRDEYEGVVDLGRVEMCYWNESDGRHKLFAYSVSCFSNGKYSPGQFDGIQFYRYDSNTKKMTYCEDVGFKARMFDEETNAYVSYALPRAGKDIKVTVWLDSGKKQKTLKWGGRRFSY